MSVSRVLSGLTIRRFILLSCLFLFAAQTACTWSPPRREWDSTSLPRVRVLKKKIVMTAFVVKAPIQVQDIDDIAQGIPHEMLSRLEYSGSFLVRQSKNLLSYERVQAEPSTELVKQVARENDAQFVIAGEVRSAGVRSDKKYFGLWETRHRQIEIEFAIYDGYSGAFLSRHHLMRATDNEGAIGRDKVFGSVAFYATDFGRAIDSLLQESVAWIRTDLASFPMMARIIQVNGNEFSIDAGLGANLIVGDTGLLIQEADQLPLTGLSAQQSKPLQYGLAQSNLGVFKIIQVQYPFAIGQKQEQQAANNETATSAPGFEIKVGDLVRFDAKN